VPRHFAKRYIGTQLPAFRRRIPSLFLLNLFAGSISLLLNLFSGQEAKNLLVTSKPRELDAELRQCDLASSARISDGSTS
jgi:hypothetical protein